MIKARTVVVTTPAADQNLVTLANLQADLEITGEDTYLNRQIAAVSNEIATYCGRTFKAETITETIHYDWSFDGLSLSRFPVQSITSISLDGTTVSSSLYTAQSTSGVIYALDSSSDNVTWAAGRYVVVYVAGYSTIPSDLEQACISLVNARRSARGRDPSLRSEKIPDVWEASYWVAGGNEYGLPPDIKTVLDRYRVVAV